VQKTEQQLRDALHALIGEKPYDAIGVKEILHRANVGRSTFYSHFRDKDALLLHGLEDILAAGRHQDSSETPQRSERAVRFSLPFFQFHEQHRHSAKPRTRPSEQAALHRRLSQMLAARVADELRYDPPPRSIPARLVGEFVASSFILVLDWWIDDACALSASEADAAFRALVLPSLRALLD
jgi:AcrR family transcriptional regulator